MSLTTKQRESAERSKRQDLGIVTNADLTYRKYKNAQQLEREKYLGQCEYQNFNHSDTSSDCSFDDDPKAIIMKSQDRNYNIRIEKLLPKHLRRIRYHDITEKKQLARDEYLNAVRKNPENYLRRKGLREFFVAEQKLKEKNDRKKISKVTKVTQHNFPWLSILTPNEVLLPDSARDQLIREKYYEIINSDMTPDELINKPETIKFIQWYEGVRNKTIVPAPFDSSQFAIETKGQVKKLKMVKPTIAKKKDKKEIGVIGSSDESESTKNNNDSETSY